MEILVEEEFLVLAERKRGRSCVPLSSLPIGTLVGWMTGLVAKRSRRWVV